MQGTPYYPHPPFTCSNWHFCVFAVSNQPTYTAEGSMHILRGTKKGVEGEITKIINDYIIRISLK